MCRYQSVTDADRYIRGSPSLSSWLGLSDQINKILFFLKTKLFIQAKGVSNTFTDKGMRGLLRGCERLFNIVVLSQVILSFALATAKVEKSLK
jgi:hypothetical protein